MNVRISQLHNEDRLVGTVANLMRGVGHATIEVYGNTPDWPGAITESPTGTLLAIFTLADTIGTVGSNKLTLTLPPNAVALVDGTAVYARWKDRSGAASIDTDISDFDGDGAIKLESVDVVAGGVLRMLSGEIG